MLYTLQVVSLCLLVAIASGLMWRQWREILSYAPRYAGEPMKYHEEVAFRLYYEGMHPNQGWVRIPSTYAITVWNHHLNAQHRYVNVRPEFKDPITGETLTVVTEDFGTRQGFINDSLYLEEAA
jgi:hypothetical protein